MNNRIIEWFGKTVGGYVASSPRNARMLLRAGYAVNALQLRLFPDRHLLPHQRYAAVVCSRAIRRPLRRPDRTAVVNLFFPCEILHAMDITPQFTEGLACYLNGAGTEQTFIKYAENTGVPQTYCSYHKTLLGASFSDVMPAPRFVANTSLACDANMGTFRSIAKHYRVPHCLLDIPNICTKESIQYVTHQLKELVSMIEETMKEKLDEDRLTEVILRGNRSMRLYREHFALLSERNLSTDMTSEMYKIFFTHVLKGTPEAEHYFKLLVQDTRAAARSSGQKRILWIHTFPHWQESIGTMLNFNAQHQILTCDLNFDNLEELDEHHPYESMAERLLKNSFNGGGENRAERCTAMARELKADAAIYFCHWGCKQTLGNAQLIRKHLEAEGIPVLVLDGDGCDRKNINDGQMTTRLQAFLEMLEANR